MKFPWDKENDAPSVDAHAVNLGVGGASVPVATPNQSSDGTVSAHTVSAARENALNLSATSTVRKRGRPSKDARASGDDSGSLQGKIDAQIAAQLDALHEPKAWAALLCAPADTALALTGREHWKTSADERATAGATGSALARTLMITNPRALALCMFSACMMNLYLPRIIKEAQYLREKKAKDAEKPA